MKTMSHAEAAVRLGGPLALLKAQATTTLEFCARYSSSSLSPSLLLASSSSFLLSLFSLSRSLSRSLFLYFFTYVLNFNREASQIFGGLAYTRGGQGEKVERIYREVRAYAIPAGSEEIMVLLSPPSSLPPFSPLPPLLRPIFSSFIVYHSSFIVHYF